MYKKSMSVCVIMFFLTCLPLHAEYIFLKDGSIIEGDVIDRTEKKITLLDKNNKSIVINRDNIIRLTGSKRKLRKVYVNIREGKSFSAYLISEEGGTFIFRKNIDKPEEITLGRGDVLSMAEKNPSGLRGSGEKGSESVNLEWDSSYGEILKYNIYIKIKEKEEYQLKYSTNKLSAHIDGLKGNTDYYFTVTAVDDDGYESLPSNEIKIRTKNIPPDQPEIASVEKKDSGECYITWYRPEDKDGTVDKYRIYATRNGKREMLAEIKSTGYTLRNNAEYEQLEITAIDNLGAESVPVSLNDSSHRIKFTPGVIVTFGDFSEIADYGFGAEFSYSLNNIFTRGLLAGMESGFYYFPGKDTGSWQGKSVENMCIVPAYMSMGWIMPITKNLTLMPEVSAGIVYMSINYSVIDQFTMAEIKKESSGIDPAARCTVQLDWCIYNSFSLGVTAGWGVIFENERILQYVICGLNCAVRF